MKLNKLFRLILLVILFTASFLIGCGEDRYMKFPDIDLPDNVTLTVEASTGMSFDIFVSSDYRQERDELGNRIIVHNSEQVDAFTGNFSQTYSLVDSETFPLVDPDERHFSVQLKCNLFEPVSKEDTGSFHLIIKFNGEGNFDDGNYDKTFFLESTTEPAPEPIELPPEPIELPPESIELALGANSFQLDDLIGVRIIFSRYDGISKEDLIGSDYR